MVAVKPHVLISYGGYVRYVNSPKTTWTIARTSIYPPKSRRCRPFSSYRPRRKQRRVIDETTLGGAQHKPSLSGPSLGHLISELSATTPDMVKNGLRAGGETIAEEQRTLIRTVAKWLMGFPVVVASGWIGWMYLTGNDAEKVE